MTRTMPFDPPARPEAEPVVRILFDQINHRIQVTIDHTNPSSPPTDDQHQCQHWDGRKWYYVPFLETEEDFHGLAELLAEITGAFLTIEDSTSLGPIVALRGWPETLFEPGTGIAFRSNEREIVIDRPEHNQPSPMSHRANFLRHLDGFQQLAIFLGNWAKLRTTPKINGVQANAFSYKQ